MKGELQELYFEAGAGLYDSQTLEYGISLLLFLLSQQGLISLKIKDTENILEGRSRETLGQLFRILKTEVSLDADTEWKLRSALKARNHLVHHSLVDNVERMCTEAGRKEVVEEIRRLRSLIQEGIKCVDGFLDRLIRRYGVTMSQLETFVRQQYDL